MALRIPSTFTGGDVANPINLPAGSATAPGLGWTADADGSGTGLYRSASNLWNETYNGARQVVHSGSLVGYLSGYNIGWYSASFASFDTFFTRRGAGIAALCDASGNTRYFLGAGGTLASAATLPVPNGRICLVSGTTNITNIATTGLADGVVVTLVFLASLLVVKGGNLKINADFSATADDTLTIGLHTSNWYEIGSRVVI